MDTVFHLFLSSFLQAGVYLFHALEKRMNDLEVFKQKLRMDIRRLQAALGALEGQPMKEEASPQLSTETRMKISESMKANWANGRKREMAAEVRAKIAASQKARWAKQKSAAATAA